MPRLQLPRPPERKRYSGLDLPTPRKLAVPPHRSPGLTRPPTTRTRRPIPIPQQETAPVVVKQEVPTESIASQPSVVAAAVPDIPNTTSNSTDFGKSNDDAVKITNEVAVKSNEEVLPLGWEELFTEDGRPYYVHAESQTTTWDRPEAAAANETTDEPELTQETQEFADTTKKRSTDDKEDVPAVVVDPLPAGWKEFVTDEGLTYYCNAVDQSTTWERPTAVEPLQQIMEQEEQPQPVEEEEILHLQTEEKATPEEEPVSDPMEAPTPIEPGVESSNESHLPEGWSEVFTDEGVPYYCNELDGTTTWERPVAPGPPESGAPLGDSLVYEDAAPVAAAVGGGEGSSPWVEPVDELDVIPPVVESASNFEVPAPDHEHDDKALPPGWVELFADNGMPYYLYEPDQSVTWDRPEPIKTEGPPLEANIVAEPIKTEDPLETNIATEQECIMNETVPDDNVFESYDEHGENFAVDDPAGVPEGIQTAHEPGVNNPTPLPPGWVELQDEGGRSYYLYEPDQSTTWERPMIAPESPAPPETLLETVAELQAETVAEPLAEASEETIPGDLPVVEEQEEETKDELPPALPFNWVELVTDDGVPYYVYGPDGTSTWDRPTEQQEQEPESTIPQKPPDVAGSKSDNSPEIVDLQNGTIEEEPSQIDTIVAEPPILENPNEAEPEVVVSSSLPPGWTELRTADGMPYYFYEADQTSTWDRPVAEQESSVPDYTENQESDTKTETPDLTTTELCNEVLLETPPPEEESSPPPVYDGTLPSGWREVVTEDGQVYFFNEVDQSTTWERPVIDDALNTETAPEPPPSVEQDSPERTSGETAVNPADLSLPTGWVEALAEDGTPYYFNEVTQESTWERPEQQFSGDHVVGTADKVPEPEETQVPEQQKPIPNSDAIGKGREVLDDARSDEFSYEDVEPFQASEPLKEGWVDMDSPPESTSKLPIGWKELVDVDSGIPYYVNGTDGSTSWERPVYIEERSTASKLDSISPEETGKEDIDEGWAVSSDNFPMDPTSKVGVPSALPPGWTEEVDPTSNMPFFFNKVTGERSWERPIFDVQSPHLNASKLRAPPAIASFGFGGRFCICRPLEKPVVRIYRIQDLVRNEAVCDIVAAKKSKGIPGPLASAPDEVVAKYIDETSKGDGQLLWNLISIASKSWGRLRSSRGPSDPSSPEAMVVKLLLNDYGAVREGACAIESSGPALNNIEELLLQGKRAEAVDSAIESGNFALAFLVASMLGHDALKKAVECYVGKTDLSGRPLHAMALLFSGLLKPSATPSYWDEVDAETLRATWKYHLAGIVNNPTAKWEHLVVALGNRLAKIDPTNAIASHVCYIVCGCSIGSPKKGALMLLLGCHPTPENLALTTISAIRALELTEAYEWAKRRGNRNATIRSLQAFKVAFAALVCDYGFVECARLYLESAIECLGRSTTDVQSLAECDKPLSSLLVSFESEDLLSVAASLHCRLTGRVRLGGIVDNTPKITMDVDASFMTAHTHYQDDDEVLVESTCEPINGANGGEDFPSIPRSTPQPISHLSSNVVAQDKMQSNIPQTNPTGFFQPQESVQDAQKQEHRAEPPPGFPPSPMAGYAPTQQQFPAAGYAPTEQQFPTFTPKPAPEENTRNVPPFPNSEPPSKAPNVKGDSNMKPVVDTVQPPSNETPLVTPGVASSRPETAPSSAPANLQPSTKTTKKVSGQKRGKGFFNFGIKDYVIKKLNPEATTADLGGGMEAYYDEDKKVWVFPGEDPAEKVKPIPPPPKAMPGSAIPQTQTSRPASNDPLAAMMAPPARAPAARKTPSRKTPVKPGAFPPGMAPPKPTNFAAFAAPQQTQRQ